MTLLLIVGILTMWIVGIIVILHFFFHKPSTVDLIKRELRQIQHDLSVANKAFHEAVRRGDGALLNRCRELMQSLQRQQAEKQRQLTEARHNPDWVAEELRELQDEADRR